MTSAFSVEWSEAALEDLYRLPFAEAEAVARAVHQFSEGKGGLVVYVDGEYLLFAGEHVVMMFVEGETVHIDRVRHASGPPPT